jgi:hypothetical protein
MNNKEVLSAFLRRVKGEKKTKQQAANHNIGKKEQNANHALHCILKPIASQIN